MKFQMEMVVQIRKNFDCLFAVYWLKIYQSPQIVEIVFRHNFMENILLLFAWLRAQILFLDIFNLLLICIW